MSAPVVSKNQRKSAWSYVWRALASAGLLGMLWLVWSAWDTRAIIAWKSEAGALPFFAGMALLPAIGVPITPFFILAGATFGIRIGLLGSLVALGLNLALCYWVARGGLRPRLKTLLRRFRYELPDFSDREAGTLRFALLIKLAPGLPAFAKNYALGVAGVPFLLYLGLSMLITGVYGALFVVLGESLLEHDLRRVALAGAFALLLALVLWWVGRRKNRDNETSIELRS